MKILNKAMRKVTAAGVAAALILTFPGSEAVAQKAIGLVGAPRVSAAAKNFQPRKFAALCLPVGVRWKTFDAAKPVLQAPANIGAPMPGLVPSRPLAAIEEAALQASVEGSPEIGSIGGAPTRTPAGKKWESLAETKSWMGGKAVRLDLEGAVSGAAAVVALGASPAAAQPIPSAALSVFEKAGDAGNMLGNGLAFFLPLPEIHQTFKEGHSSTPKWKALMMISASLALGAINAPLADNSLWAVQNMFGGLAMLAVLPLGYLLPRFQRFYGYARDHAALMTALTAAALLPLSMELYSAIAAVVPAQLTRTFTKTALADLTFGVAVVTGAMYFMLFVPDIISVLRGKEPKGFTPEFSLSFFISNVARTVWTLQVALSSAAYSAKWKEYAFLTGLNIVYAAVALASYVIAKKHRGSAI